MTTQVCSICSATKTLDCFPLRKDTGKYRNECIECKNAIAREYRKRTNYKKGENRRQKKKDANAKAIKECSDCGKQKSLDKFTFRKDTNAYRNQCTKCRNAYMRIIKKQEKHKLKQNMRAQERRKTDMCFLINQRLRARLTKVLKSQNTERLATPYELLGCSVNEFKEYIGKKFTGDMSWELKNFDLDHIIPCAFFDLTDIHQQKKCFHYSNFQPLKPDANNAKRDFILEEHMEYLFSIMF